MRSLEANICEPVLVPQTDGVAVLVHHSPHLLTGQQTVVLRALPHPGQVVEDHACVEALGGAGVPQGGGRVRPPVLLQVKSVVRGQVVTHSYQLIRTKLGKLLVKQLYVALNVQIHVHEYQFVEAGKYPVIKWACVEQFVLVLPHSFLNHLVHHERSDSVNEEFIFRICGNAIQINEVKNYFWYFSDLPSSYHE